MNEIEMKLSGLANEAMMINRRPLIALMQEAYHLGIQQAAKHYNLVEQVKTGAVRTQCRKCGEMYLSRKGEGALDLEEGVCVFCAR